MKVVTCPKCGEEQRVFCVRTSYACKCGNVWTDKVVVSNYDIIGPTGLLTATQTGLIEAGKAFANAHVCESELNPILTAMAARHAQYQADHRQQGHQLFDQRTQELYRTLGPFAYAEIAAESWNWQVNDSMFALGAEMFTCWRKSSGHWAVASKRHKYFGADMAKGGSIWYACILVAD